MYMHYIYLWNLYSATSRYSYSEALPIQVRPKRKVLSSFLKELDRSRSRKGRSQGRLFQTEGPQSRKPYSVRRQCEHNASQSHLCMVSERRDRHYRPNNDIACYKCSLYCIVLSFNTQYNTKPSSLLYAALNWCCLFDAAIEFSGLLHIIYDILQSRSFSCSEKGRRASNT